MKNKNETLLEYSNRLERELGLAATNARVASFRASNGIKGMLSVGQRIKALESPAGVAPAPATPPLPASAVPRPSTYAPASTAPTPPPEVVAQPVELHGRDLYRSTVRAGFEKAGTSSLPNPSTRAEVQTSAESMSELKGRDRLQQGIRSQLAKAQGHDRNLSKAL